MPSRRASSEAVAAVRRFDKSATSRFREAFTNSAPHETSGTVDGEARGTGSVLDVTRTLSERKYKNSVLWNIHMSSDKMSRMKRLSQSRKESAGDEVSHNYRDRMSKRQEVELAQESFGRYFEQRRKDNPYSSELLLEALADFGITAMTRPEKLQLNELLAQNEKATLSFGDFCHLVEEAQAKMRQLRSFSAFQAWRVIDVNDHGALPAADVIRLLEDLGLAPPSGSPARFIAEAALDELQLDDHGLVSFHEAEFAVQQLRQHEQSTRRRKEREIQRTYDLSANNFKEFRSQLLFLHTNFNRLDDDSSGTLDPDEVLNLLSEFGCMGHDSRERTLQVVEELEEEAEGGEITFPVFLKVIKRLRELEMADKADEVQELFNSYDADRSGELDTRETCAVLVNLGLQPKTVREQEGIAQLMEEVDEDGSGNLDFPELLMMVQRIGERLMQIHRDAENEKATELGFSPSTTTALRRAYEILNMSNFTGGLGVADMERALSFMGWRLNPAALLRLLEEVDDDGDGSLDFAEFLTFMSRVEEEVRASRKVPDEKPAELRGSGADGGGGGGGGSGAGGAEGHRGISSSAPGGPSSTAQGEHEPTSPREAPRASRSGRRVGVNSAAQDMHAPGSQFKGSVSKR